MVLTDASTVSELKKTISVDICLHIPIWSLLTLIRSLLTLIRSLLKLDGAYGRTYGERASVDICFHLSRPQGSGRPPLHRVYIIFICVCTSTTK